MKYDPSSLKWGICDNTQRLIAAFDDQQTASTFHSTVSNQGKFQGQKLQVVNLTSGQPISERELEGAGDRVNS